MNEKVAQALQKGKEIAVPLCAKGKEMALRGYATGNELMDKVSFLQKPLHKKIVWGVVGAIFIMLVSWLLFPGSNGPENAFRNYAKAIVEKNWLMMQESISDGNPTHGGEPMSQKEKEDFATSEFCKGQMQSDAMVNLGKWLNDAKILSIKTKGDRAVIKFRPIDKDIIRDFRNEGVLGCKIEAVKTDKGWKINSGTLDTINRE